ncbi:MAG: DUF4340 domain-containing protein [bacterium]
MMTRKTYILGGLFIVLLLVAYLVTQQPGEQSAATDSAGNLVAIDSLAVDKIEITSPTSTVVLEKKGVEWYLQKPISYRADQNNVASVIQETKRMEIKSIVSSKPEKQSVFQVDSTGSLVKIYQQGVETASFIIGKPGNSYSETYVRKSNSNDVILVGSSLSYIFTKPLKEWRDRLICKVPREKIQEVKYQYGDTIFALTWKDSTWMIGKDSTQSSVVEGVLSSLSEFQTDDFIDTAFTAPPKAAAQITVGSTHLTFFQLKGQDKFFVRSSTSPQWFEVQSWRANQVLKRKKELVKTGA